MAKWNHDKVILALVQRGEKVSNLEIVDIYVQLYPQKPNIATIYTPSSPATRNGEWQVQLRESHKNFDATKISEKDSFLQLVGTSRETSKFKVIDWDAFAAKMGLTFGVKNEEE
ncbi:MAG: hypothetical protein JST20_11995 [Bacteroidetes bacterium]|nr:hypothetical protein [Bacteroidota bacterium]